MKSSVLLITLFCLAFITEAQIVYIPDANFKTALVENCCIDSNHDGEIQESEAVAFSDILDIYDKNISDLTGIEAFVNVIQLNCSNNPLCGLNITNNIALYALSCRNTMINNIDLSQNTLLTHLDCSMNYLTNLDISNNTALTNLFCFDNSISNLDISYNTELSMLYCNQNLLTSIDLSYNPMLTILFIDDNQLTDIDVSHNPILNSFICRRNKLTSIDLSNNQEIYEILCNDNENLTSLFFKNGHNSNIENQFFVASGNPKLYCIEVDNPSYSDSHWYHVDPWATFNSTCNYSIDENEKIFDYQISPNPFTDQVSLTFENCAAYNIKILDIESKEVFNTNVNGSTAILPLTELPEGNYIIQVSSKVGIENKKIIKH